MHSIILIVHVVICVILMGMILLQSGKGASIGASFGGGAQTVFGARGPATFFQKMTIALAVGFLLTSISLARMARVGGEPSVIEKVTAPVSAAPVETPTKSAVPAADPTPTAPAAPTTEPAAQPK